MSPDEQLKWKCDALDRVFVALAESESLKHCLVFKGARVLNVLLGGVGRQSTDIDANLSDRFADEVPELDKQREFLEVEIGRTLRRSFERDDPVRFAVSSVRASLRPARGHPRGWTAFEVSIVLLDRASSARTLPRLDLDVAAPEALSASSVAPLPLGEREIVAYTLERVTGEKLRAFLSSLGAYKRKVGKPHAVVRAKDLYDIARVLRHVAITDTPFWRAVGEEFRQACASRYVDCEGLAAFAEELETTRAAYQADPTIPSADIPFPEAWEAVQRIVHLLERERLVPFAFPLPALA